MNTWKVYNNSKLIETVYYSKECDGWEVKHSLINHDGFPSTISIMRVDGNVAAKYRRKLSYIYDREKNT